MSLLSETKTWLSTEKPDREEILLTIDNLSHEYGRASPERRAELNKCTLLCSAAKLGLIEHRSIWKAIHQHRHKWSSMLPRWENRLLSHVRYCPQLQRRGFLPS